MKEWKTFQHDQVESISSVSSQETTVQRSSVCNHCRRAVYAHEKTHTCSKGCLTTLLICHVQFGFYKYSFYDESCSYQLLQQAFFIAIRWIQSTFKWIFFRSFSFLQDTVRCLHPRCISETFPLLLAENYLLPSARGARDAILWSARARVRGQIRV